MKAEYLETITLLENLHRLYQEIVKRELEGLDVHDINNVQTDLLHDIGNAGATVGVLTSDGRHSQSNVSYNLKKMVENDYVVQERSTHDRRSMHVNLTDKGRKLNDEMTRMHADQDGMNDRTSMSSEDWHAVGGTLKQLEDVWTRTSGLLRSHTTYTRAA
jgi:DNA-binding MarR family transcriptional regulator